MLTDVGDMMTDTVVSAAKGILAMQETQTEVLFNPLDPNFRIDPYSVYARLRAEAPIYRPPFGGVVLSRYADCVAVLRDPRSSSDFRNSDEFKRFVEANGPEQAAGLVGETRPFLFLDPPDHTRLRGLVNKAFTPKTVEGLRQRIQEIVNDLLDAVATAGEMEVIEDFAHPLPVRVICEMLGVPVEDHETFKQWSRELARSLDPEDFLPPAVIERRQKAIESFTQYFAQLIEKRRQDPRDDLISALIAAEEAGDKLSEAELLATCILLLVAGHETTVNLIGNGTLALLRNLDQLALLRDDPLLARNAVEEVLRYDPPVQFTGRVATDDVQVEGVTIPKGQQAVILLASANRDPDVFEDPDTLDITRTDNRHLSFGGGHHYCVGAPLARLEGEIALGTLVQRFDGLHLLTLEPHYKENIVLRGLAALPVGFDR
jgi:cytochrome P450